MFNEKINTPEVFLNEDFIGVWDNVILDDFNNYVINLLNESTQIVPRSNTNVEDAQLDIAAFNPLISKVVLFLNCVKRYPKTNNTKPPITPNPVDLF